MFLPKSEREDLNLRPLLPQSSALPSCATSRYSRFTILQDKDRKSNGKTRKFSANWDTLAGVHRSQNICRIDVFPIVS
jgi:hypothetical protein